MNLRGALSDCVDEAGAGGECQEEDGRGEDAVDRQHHKDAQVVGLEGGLRSDGRVNWIDEDGIWMTMFEAGEDI